MKSSKLINLKHTLLVSGVYMLLIAVLLIGISTAKYSAKRIAYTDYSAASFNAVILGEYTNDTVTAFTKSLNVTDCLPGMTASDDKEKNTAKTIPFSVANGIGTDNAADVSVDYTIRLRTTRNLPIIFSLDHTVVSNGEDGVITTRKRYRASEPTLVESNTESGNVWYEWVFYQTEEAKAADPTDEESISSELTDGEQTDGEEGKSENHDEVYFSLIGGEFSLNNHTLIVEWPVDNTDGQTIADNSTYYMKEVELLQILVTVSSKNQLNGDSTEYQFTPDELYGSGIIILNPDEATIDSKDMAYPYHYSYEFDLRAFRETSVPSGESAEEQQMLVYSFTVGNGVGLGVKQTAKYTDYVLELKVPYTESDKETLATKDYSYTLELYDGGAYTVLESDGCAYRLYDELYGSDGYGTFTIPSGADIESNIQKWSKSDSQYRLYKVYFFSRGNGTPFRIVNKSLSVMGTYEDYDASANFRLLLDTGDETFNGQTAFENKLELIVRSVPTGTVEYEETEPGEPPTEAPNEEPEPSVNEETEPETDGGETEPETVSEETEPETDSGGET